MTGEKSAEDTEVVLLRIRIKPPEGSEGTGKVIKFPFDVRQDTAGAVAAEMTEELAVSPSYQVRSSNPTSSVFDSARE